MESLKTATFTPQEAGETKQRRERKERRDQKSKSPKPKRERKEKNDQEGKKEKEPRERKPQEPWKQSRRVFNDMLKVKSFVDSIGGEQKCRDMKKAFSNAMKKGNAAEQKEQWDFFTKLIQDYSTHIGANKDQMIVENKERRSGADGEPLNQAFNEERAVVQEKPEGVIEIAAGSTEQAEIQVFNNTYWPWKKGCKLASEIEQVGCPIEPVSVMIEEQVRGKQPLKISVPLTVKADFAGSDDTVYTIKMAF